jgi:hypothetical protein
MIPVHTSAIVTLAALAIGKLKFLVVLRKIKLPTVSAFHALINAKSPVIASSSKYVTPLNILD